MTLFSILLIALCKFCGVILFFKIITIEMNTITNIINNQNIWMTYPIGGRSF